VLLLASVGAVKGMAEPVMSPLASVGVTHPAIPTTTAVQISPQWDANMRATL